MTLIFLKKDEIQSTPQWIIKSLKTHLKFFNYWAGAIGYIIRESGLLTFNLSNVSGLASILSIFS